MTDEALFCAVDDYLYSEVPGRGYPEGHCNPRYLEALRQVFLKAAGVPEEEQPSPSSAVDPPDHYNKHLWRAGLKGEALEDLQKAAWYLQREIERVEKKLNDSRRRS